VTAPLRALPVVDIRIADVLHRVHRARNDVAWFGASGDERFDPPSSHRAAYGACYLGCSDMAAYVEVFGGLRAVSQSDIDRRRLSVLRPHRDLTVVDLTDRSVLGDFGITASVSTGDDYGPPQQLSAQVYDEGFDGVLYRVRHDPALRLDAVAMFGEPGVQRERFADIKTDAIPSWLIDEAWRTFGIEVIADVPLP
jgi:hypothetical protein